MKKLSDWTANIEWIEDTILKSKNYETISFDIFDTVLTRTFDSPVDVFAEVEKLLLNAGYEEAYEFANQREIAEQIARSKQFTIRNAEDVSLDEIYAELPALNKTFKNWDEAKKLELSVEHDALFAVPDLLELIQRLQHNGKKVVFVSDMYLPSSFLAEVLHNCGYNKWNELIVSNEVNATKATGNIWPLLKLRHPGNILHIGDDEWSDVESPRRHDIDSIAFLRARTERRTAGSLRPEILSFSKAIRRITLSRRGSLMTSSAADIYEDLGRTYGALIVGSFMQWLIKRSKLHGIEHLYFCARDGYLLQQVWNRLELSQSTGITISYLEVARRPLNLARGYLESQPHRLDQQLIDFLCSSIGTTTVETVLKRIDLNNDPQVIKSAIDTFGSLQVEVSGHDMYTAMEELFRKYSERIYKKISGHYDRLVEYLEQEGLNSDRKLAIVDMGWHGTMQRSLHKIIDPLGENKHRLMGFYYGLWPRSLENIYACGLMESAFNSMFLKEEQQPALHESVDILEELHSAPHGTVIDYALNHNGRWSGVLADSPLEIEQHNEITRHFQYGVIEELEAIYSGNSSTGITLDELTIENGIGAMSMVGLSPSKEELKALSRLSHCATFDHLALSTIIPHLIPETQEQMYRSFWQSHWRIGLLRHWLSISTLEQRNIIKEMANHHLPYQHARTKRIFQ